MKSISAAGLGLHFLPLTVSNMARGCLSIECISSSHSFSNSAWTGALFGPPSASEAEVRPVKTPEGSIRFDHPFAAVGVRIDNDILLFDPTAGDLLPRKPVSLGEVRANPALAAPLAAHASATAGDPRFWQVYLAVPLSSLAPRMQFLEKELQGPGSVHLYTDPKALRDRFESLNGALKGVACDFWHPPQDRLCYMRIFSMLQGKDDRVIFRSKSLPWELFPAFRTDELGGKFDVISLTGLPGQEIQGRFAAELIGTDIARNKLIRGRYSDASDDLSKIKEQEDSHMQQVARESGLNNALAEWWKQATPLAASASRARRTNPGGQGGDEEWQHFMQQEVTHKMESAILRATAPLKAAESSYQLALCVIEQAEHSQAAFERDPSAENRSKAVQKWKNAQDWLKQYIENYQSPGNFYQAQGRTCPLTPRIAMPSLKQPRRRENSPSG